MADSDQVKQVLRRWRSLKSERAVWDTHWDDLARVMLPRRLGFVTQTTPGEKRVDDIYDGTAMQAARGLANALGTMMRDGQFFFIRGGEDADEGTDEARDWMADSEARLREALESPRSRFRQATGEADLDLVVFGTAVLFEAEGRSLDHLLFQSVHLKDACVFFNDEGEAEGIYTLSADNAQPIVWLSPGENTLAIGTKAGEWTPTSNGAVLTPVDIRVSQQTTHGSAAIQPVRVGHIVLFVQKAKRKVREFGFSFEVDGYRAFDMTRLSRHVTRGGIVEMAYAEEPNSLVWAVREDGQLLSMTFRREEDVVGWTRHVIGG